MKIKEIKDIIGEKRLKKSLGQSLLIDENIAKKMVDTLKPEGGIVLEIGPGLGIITKKLVEKSKKVIVVEIDKFFCDFLKRKFNNGIVLLPEDFLKINPAEFEISLIIGSLPYRGSKKMLLKVIMEFKGLERGVFLLQKDVADVILSKPGSKNYSPITVIYNIFSESARVANVKKSAFFPRPNVDSSILLVNFRKEPIFPVGREFFDFLWTIFKTRRKTIYNNLREFFALQRSDILNKRAEELTPEEIFKIYKGLKDERILRNLHKIEE